MGRIANRFILKGAFNLEGRAKRYFNWRARLKRRILGDAKYRRYKTKPLAQSERPVFREHAVSRGDFSGSQIAL
jgi:hypothetical protein